MITEDEKKELRKIRQETNEPQDEHILTPLLENKGKIKRKIKKKNKEIEKIIEISQLRINIPKKFIKLVGIEKESHKAKFTYLKKENKLIMEIVKNEESK